MTEGLPPFEKFEKIPRLNRDIIITEKIDGTNGQVYISESGLVVAGSRNRWLMPGKNTDNFGFAAWVKEHEDLLRDTLGPGRHFGEWYGQGIGRGYGLKEKRFALFNIHRWNADNIPPGPLQHVPILYVGPASQMVDLSVQLLREYGSVLVPGFMRPEGIVVYHTAGGHLYKVTLENDEAPKGLVK